MYILPRRTTRNTRNTRALCYAGHPALLRYHAKHMLLRRFTRWPQSSRTGVRCRAAGCARAARGTVRSPCAASGRAGPLGGRACSRAALDAAQGDRLQGLRAALARPLGGRNTGYRVKQLRARPLGGRAGVLSGGRVGRRRRIAAAMFHFARRMNNANAVPAVRRMHVRVPCGHARDRGRLGCCAAAMRALPHMQLLRYI